MGKKMRESDLPDAREFSGRIKRLALSLMKHGMAPEEAVDFIRSARGVLDSDYAGNALWFHDNLPRIAGRPDFPEIREDCACCLGGKRAELAREIRKEATLAQRIDKLAQTPYIIGNHIEKIDDGSFLVCFFPDGLSFYMCSCLRFEEGKQPCDMDAGYCACCAGHVKHHVSASLGQEVRVEFVSSSLVSKGKEGCRFRVTVL